ncbi:4-alpha-glucanotransferase [Vibrio hippocampi]|nr:4-alpha-glucanotransferase [Vibrio hippocampi]
MIDSNTLMHVADMARIADRYINATGQETQVEASTIVELLKALGYDTNDSDSLLASAEKKHRQEVLDPVCVIQDDDATEVSLYLSSSARESDFSWRLTTEQGEVFEGYLQSQIRRDERQNGGPLVFELPDNLPWGYHQLEVSRKRRKLPYQSLLIRAPRACYKPTAIEQGKKLWGPSIQLYTLKSDDNWGIGDFSDLKKLVSEIADRGGDFVGINPIHSLFPANPEAASPYSPSSRRWLNILYIDVTATPGFAENGEAQALIQSAEFHHRLQQARQTDWVDYRLVSELKMSALELVFKQFKQQHLDSLTPQGEAFLGFVEQGGDSLLHQAAFDAIHCQLRAQDEAVWGWPVFPEKLRHFEFAGTQKFIRDNQDSIHFHQFLQWVADTQISRVQALAEQKGMTIGLYRDLAVGVADSGSETWADKGNLVMEAGIGAPPDILGPQGQSWGLPPLNPQVLEQTGYQAYIDLLRANMKHCGCLRIDHVLGLLRLWWIPRGKAATEGAYLYYSVETMLAILALESHRHQCTVIGEDLGTVPVEIEHILREAGVHSYKVFFFETADDGGFVSPQHYAPQSMAALCTHDMPTLRGYWHCEDLKMGQSLGIYPEDKLAPLFEQRLRDKQRILDSIAWHGYLPSGVGRDASLVPMDSYLSEALQLHLASGATNLLSVQLEDWLEMDLPVNIPGTTQEYQNWRRKLSLPIEQMFEQDSVNRIAQQLTQVRSQVG